jgi:hypothetical protein
MILIFSLFSLCTITDFNVVSWKIHILIAFITTLNSVIHFSLCYVVEDEYSANYT